MNDGKFHQLEEHSKQLIQENEKLNSLLNQQTQNLHKYKRENSDQSNQISNFNLNSSNVLF